MWENRIGRDREKQRDMIFHMQFSAPDGLNCQLWARRKSGTSVHMGCLQPRLYLLCHNTGPKPFPCRTILSDRPIDYQLWNSRFFRAAWLVAITFWFSPIVTKLCNFPYHHFRGIIAQSQNVWYSVSITMYSHILDEADSSMQSATGSFDSLLGQVDHIVRCCDFCFNKFLW